MASGQPIGDLLDVLGVSRFWPEVFDSLAARVEGRREVPQGDRFAADRDARLAGIAVRVRGR